MTEHAAIFVDGRGILRERRVERGRASCRGHCHRRHMLFCFLSTDSSCSISFDSLDDYRKLLAGSESKHNVDVSNGGDKHSRHVSAKDRQNCRLGKLGALAEACRDARQETQQESVKSVTAQELQAMSSLHYSPGLSLFKAPVRLVVDRCLCSASFSRSLSVLGTASCRSFPFLPLDTTLRLPASILNLYNNQRPLCHTSKQLEHSLTNYDLTIPPQIVY